MKRFIIIIIISLTLLLTLAWYWPSVRFTYYTLFGVPIENDSNLKRVVLIQDSPITIEIGEDEMWTAMNVRVETTSLPVDTGPCRDFTRRGPDTIVVYYVGSTGRVEIRKYPPTPPKIDLGGHINHFYFTSSACWKKSMRMVFSDFKWRTVELIHRVGMLVEMLMRLKIKIQIEFE